MAVGEQKKKGREPRDACDVLIPILREKFDPVGEAGMPMPASVMQPIFDRGRATWHDAQIRHTMDPPSMHDGRGALHRHDLDGRDHDRHHHGLRAPCNTRRFPTAHLDPAAPEAGHAILCRVRVQGRGGAGLAPQHHEASHGFCTRAQRWKKHEHYNESLAPPHLDIRGGTKACGESRSRAPQWHNLR